jgi:UDP-N-acetylglucosamine 1-carboxyvinyltransferase
MGAKIKGAGTDVIRITGVDKFLTGKEYTIIPDQIEAGTYMMAAAITGGDITVNNVIPKHLESLSSKLQEMNCKMEIGDDFVNVKRSGELKGVSIKTLNYPGFPTDYQPQMSALLSVATGKNDLHETVWDNRFQYIGELQRLGANIMVHTRMASITGVPYLTGTTVNAVDIRAGAAMVLAGLVATGETTIGNVGCIDRGYENIVEKLKILGADIERISYGVVS